MDRLTCVELKVELAFSRYDQCFDLLMAAHSCYRRFCTGTQGSTEVVSKYFGFDLEDEALDSSTHENVAVESKQRLVAYCRFAGDCCPNWPVVAISKDLKRFPCSTDSVVASASSADPFEVLVLLKESALILDQACVTIAVRARSNYC